MTHLVLGVLITIDNFEYLSFNRVNFVFDRLDVKFKFL